MIEVIQPTVVSIVYNGEPVESLLKVPFKHLQKALAQVMGRLGWDQETMMPRGAAGQRSEEMAALEGVLHARRTDPRIADWLAAAVAPDAVGEAQPRGV
jgi:carboxypeptidase Taq